MPRSSNGMFINCKGQKVVGLTDLTPVARPSPSSGTPIPSGTMFPGTTKLIPAGSFWDWYWRIKVSGVYMGADGKNPAFYLPQFGGSGYIMAALMSQPNPTLVNGPNTQIEATFNGQVFADIVKRTPVEEDNDVFSYRTVIDGLVANPSDPALLAQAATWVDRANSVCYKFSTQYAPGKWGATIFNYSSASMANVQADILRVQMDPSVTFGQEDV